MSLWRARRAMTDLTCAAAGDRCDSRAGQVWRADISILIGTVFVLILRLIARWLAKAGLWWDDYIMLVASPLALSLPILNLVGEYPLFGKIYNIWRTLIDDECPQPRIMTLENIRLSLARVLISTGGKSCSSMKTSTSLVLR